MLPHSSERRAVNHCTMSAIPHGFVFLFQAARDGKIDLVKRRLEQLGKGHKKITQQDIYNTTALHYAVRYNHVEVVKVLLEYGAGRNLESLLSNNPCIYKDNIKEKLVENAHECSAGIGRTREKHDAHM